MSECIADLRNAADEAERTVSGRLHMTPGQARFIANEIEALEARLDNIRGYIAELTPGIGAGDDPVGLLIASHAALRAERDQARYGEQDMENQRDSALSRLDRASKLLSDWEEAER